MGAVVTVSPEFREQMRRLMGLRFAPADLTTHWEALAAVPLPVLEAAVSRAQKTRVEFPTPAELLEDCDAVKGHVQREPEPDRGIDLPEPVTLGTLPTGKVLTAERVWKYYHEDCGDTGTESLWCGSVTLEDGKTTNPLVKPWYRLQACERHKPHEAHEWTRHCTCFDSNPHLIRKREAQQKFAESAGRK